ncbi:hypothetical protein B296_00055901, partial [Ensete ventricosum]
RPVGQIASSRKRRMRRRPWRRTFFVDLFLFLFVLLLVLFVLRVAFIGGDAEVRAKRSAELPLRFSSDGGFKILQVADMHYGNGLVTRCRDVLPSEAARCSDLNSTLFLKRMIEAEKPDLIAFTGSPTDSSSSGTSIFAWKIPCFTRVEGALEIHLFRPCVLSYSCSLLRSCRVAVAEAVDPLFLVVRSDSG